MKNIKNENGTFLLKMHLQFFGEGDDGDGGEQPKPPTTRGARNLTSLELQETLADVMNIADEDRGGLAVEMVNITNATKRIITERNTYKQELQTKQEELDLANKQIGKLYGQLTAEETTGGDGAQTTNTPKTLMQLGRQN